MRYRQFEPNQNDLAQRKLDLLGGHEICAGFLSTAWRGHAHSFLRLK